MQLESVRERFGGERNIMGPSGSGGKRTSLQPGAGSALGTPTPVAVIRIGVLTPHAAIGPEEEFPAMAPGRVVTRVVYV